MDRNRKGDPMKEKITLTGYDLYGESVCHENITGWSKFKIWSYKRKMKREKGVKSWSENKLPVE